MNELKRLAEFNKVLASYHVSPATKATLQTVPFVVMLAPTSSGRNTIIRELVRTGKYHYIVSDTTRQPRINDGVLEQNGVEYWFRAEDEVLHDLKDGKYLEAEVIHNQQVSGVSIRELEAARHEHKVAVTDIDLQGVENILKVKPDTIAVLVLPPSFEEWQRRIKERGEMSGEEHKRRMETACRIFDSALNHPDYQFVINDTVADAVQQIMSLTQTHKTDPTQLHRGRELAQRLYDQTKKLLSP